MIGLLPILARWRFGLSIAAAVAVFGLIVASWHYRSAYHAERALRRADRAAYTQAQAEATRIAYDALRAAETRSQIKAKEADHEHALALADARSATDRYIAAHRVRGQAVAGVASPAIASAESGGAQNSDRSSSAPDMVAVTAGDIQVCTINTTRLEAAREWALGLKISP
jgi:hypothetical protein